jgi:putative ABC transport system permease protein
MWNLQLDLKYSLRTLLKSPGFTVIAILTVALGIGANTAIFSMIESVLLRQLPYSDPDKLVMLWGSSDETGNRRGQVSFTDVEDWRRSNSAFEDIAAFAQWSAVLNTGDLSQRVPAIQVSDAFFRVMRAKPLFGRLFVPEDQIDGKDFEIVISYDLWQKRFGGDPNVIGRTVHINALAYTVIGVLPADFAPLPRNIVNGVTGIYRPCAEIFDPSKRDNRHFRAIARLKPGSSLATAQTQMKEIAAQLARANPEENSGYSVRAISLREDVVGGIRPALLLLYGGVLFVLLIACANLANLLLARFARREREIAVRSALGATQWRLIRQLATESLLLAAMGGTLGLLLSSWLISGAQKVLVGRLAGLQGLELNGTVLLFTLAASVLAGLCFGLIPALYSSRVGIASALKTSASASIGGSHASLRNGLVIAEVALALVLLACSGLLLRTVQRLQQVDPGFRTDSIVSAEITLPYVRYGATPASVHFYDVLLDRVKQMPGVASVGAVSTLPMTDFDTVGFKPESIPESPGRSPDADRYVVSSEYMQTMGINLKSGRLLNEADAANSTPVVVVNETLARRIWPGQDAIGKRLRFPPDDEKRPWRTVVGIVGDVKQYTLDGAPTMQLYVPYRQDPANYMTLVVRGTAPPADLVAQLRELVKSTDSDAAVSDPELLSQILADSIQSRRLTVSLLAAFACLAMLLAAIGIYGVLSYLVSQRTREIGVRMALGATQHRILSMILKQGLRLVLGGIAIGLMLALLAGRAIASMLFAVKPYDLLTFAAITVVLTIVSTTASYLPARRATNVDPMQALRQE